MLKYIATKRVWKCLIQTALMDVLGFCDAVHVGKSTASSMATSTGEDRKPCSSSDVDLLLHPELLSQEFMQLILREVS